jgi:integrase
MASTATARTGTATSSEVRASFVTVPLDQAAEEALGWWDRYEMLTDLDLGANLDEVLAAARRRRLGTTADLRAEASKIIADVTGIAAITAFASVGAANSLHRVRNTIAALLFAVEALHGDHHKRPYDLIEGLPKVAPRHGSKRRPLTDDEVLLARSSSVHTLHARVGRYARVATQYALAECGAHPVETTTVRPVDFDSVTAPQTVLLSGDGSRSSRREVRLTPFAARLLAESLDRHLAAGTNAATWRLCFQGEPSSASASASGNLKKFTKKVGINQPALEASAVTRWRIHKEVKDRGGVAALRLLGKVKNTEHGPTYDVRKVDDFLNLAPADVTPEETDEYDDLDFGAID